MPSPIAVADAKPPAGILRAKQADSAPCNGNPPEQVKSHVRKKGAREDDWPLNGGCDRSDQHRSEAPSESASRKAGEHDQETNSNCGTESEPCEIGTEDVQLRSSDPGGEGRIDDVTPVQVACVGVGKQFVTVETVSAAGGDVPEGKCEPSKPYEGAVAGAKP